MLENYEIRDIANKIDVFAVVMCMMVLITLCISDQVLQDLQHHLLYFPIIAIGLSILSQITMPIITKAITPIMVRLYHGRKKLPYGAISAYNLGLKIRCKGTPLTIFVALVSCYLTMSHNLQYKGILIIQILLCFLVSIVVLAVYNAFELNGEMQERFKGE